MSKSVAGILYMPPEKEDAIRDLVEEAIDADENIRFYDIKYDDDKIDLNKEYMENSSYGRLMAHGALLVGFMSTVSTMAIAHTRDAEETPVSAGYDKIRFMKPVFLGDTVTVQYTISKIEMERKRSYAEIEVTNQDGTLVAVGRHILQWVPNI